MSTALTTGLQDQRSYEGSAEQISGSAPAADQVLTSVEFNTVRQVVDENASVLNNLGARLSAVLEGASGETFSSLREGLEEVISNLSRMSLSEDFNIQLAELEQALSENPDVVAALRIVLALIHTEVYRGEGYEWAVIDKDLNVLLAIDSQGGVIGKFDYSGMPEEIKSITGAGYSVDESSEYLDAYAVVDKLGSPVLVVRKTGKVVVDSMELNGLAIEMLEPKEGYAFAITDTNGHVLFGITKSGKVYLQFSEDVNISTQNISLTTNEYTFYKVGGGIMAHSHGTSDVTLALADSSYFTDFSAIADELHWHDGGNPYYAKAPDFNPAPVQALNSIVCWGDSLTTGSGGIDGYPAELARITGLVVSSEGAGGQGSSYIAARAGGRQILVSTESGEIPAVSAVVPLENSIHQRPMSAIGPQIMKGQIGSVLGVLARTDSNTFTFERDEDGEAIDTTGGVVFVPELGDYKERTVMIWAGRNNISDPQLVLDDIKSIVATLTPKAKRFMVLSVINGETEGVGTDGYTSIENINILLSGEYPGQYVDVRSALIEAYDAADATDVADHDADRVPNSLRTDHLHLNQDGYNLVASTLRAQMINKGWLSQ